MDKKLEKQRAKRKGKEAKQAAIRKVKKSHYLAKLKTCLDKTTNNYDATVQGDTAYCFLFTNRVFTVVVFEWGQFSSAKIHDALKFLDDCPKKSKLFFQRWDDLPANFFTKTKLKNRFKVDVYNTSVPLAGNITAKIGGSRQTIDLYHFMPFEDEMKLRQYKGCVITDNFIGTDALHEELANLVVLNEKTGLTKAEWADFKRLQQAFKADKRISKAQIEAYKDAKEEMWRLIKELAPDNMNEWAASLISFAENLINDEK